MGSCQNETAANPFPQVSQQSRQTAQDNASKGWKLHISNTNEIFCLNMFPQQHPGTDKQTKTSNTRAHASSCMRPPASAHTEVLPAVCERDTGSSGGIGKNGRVVECAAEAEDEEEEGSRTWFFQNRTTRQRIRNALQFSRQLSRTNSYARTLEVGVRGNSTEHAANRRKLPLQRGRGGLGQGFLRATCRFAAVRSDGRVGATMAFKASSAEAAKLLQEIEGTERRLKQALKTSQPDEREVKALRTGLMGSYERMLVLDYELASKNQVEQNLWKIVFYKRIEEFRKRHGKTSALLDDPDKKERAKQALSQITAAFARFLDKSSRFYMSLLRKLLVACNVSLAGYTDHGEDDEGPSFVRCDESSPKHRERKKAMLMSSERTISKVPHPPSFAAHLSLAADPKSVRSLYMEKELERDWSAAERHYRTAALLTPHVGNPHNQLAVLATSEPLILTHSPQPTYCGADLEGMFHYARAALVPQPFATARENLALLLDKNRQKLEAIVAAKPSVPPRIALGECQCECASGQAIGM
eukprot:369361-Rhodomonas_salina.1